VALMAAWDPFADPAEGPTENEEPSRKTPCDGLAVEEAFDNLDDLAVYADPAALPTAPRRSLMQSLTGFLSLSDFIATVDEVWQLPDDADSDMMKKGGALTQAVVAAGSNLGHKYACIYSRRFLSLMQDMRMGKVPFSAKRMAALSAILSGMFASDQEEFVVLPPKASFNGRVVMIFTYGGGNLNDMQDCIEWNQEFDVGCLVVALTFTAGGIYGQDQLARALEAAVNAWADAAPGVERALYIQLYSNLGMQAWCELLKLWEKQVSLPDRTRLRGPVPPMSRVLRAILLDSAPDAAINVPDTITSFSTSYGMMLASAADFDANGDPLEPTQMKQAAAQGKTELRREDNVLARTWLTMPEEDLLALSRADTATVHQLEPPVPLLFIYSTQDTIIRSRGIETYIAECEQRPSRAGLPPPQRLRYDNTQHCFHKAQKKDEYWSTVSGFFSEAATGPTT